MIKKALLFLITLVTAISSCHAHQPPNIIVIVADDLGYADVGFNGCNDIPTPHLDTFADNAMVFTDAYVAHPYCGPSRCALMTGRYPHKFGAQINIPFDPADDTLGLPLSEVFLPEVLKEHGYRTGAVGKWHLGAAKKFHPLSRGFEYFYGFTGGGHLYFPEKYPAELAKRVTDTFYPESVSYTTLLEKNGKAVEETGYLTDVLSREAVSFIKSSDDRPFFLYLAYNAPHTPMQAKAEDLKTLSIIDDETRRVYAAMVYALDRGVGQIKTILEKQKMIKNTIIIFCSDNGGHEKHGANNGPLRGGKGMTWEGGYRTPFFIHWPRHVPHSTFGGIVSALDIFPTCLAAAGIEIPQNIDGVNLVPYLTGTKKDSPHDSVYVFRYGNRNAGMRMGKWKIFRNDQAPYQLYDLHADISESRNISSANKAVVDTMAQQYEAWLGTHESPKWQGPTKHWKENKPKFDIETINTPNL